jgi:hypothetical protein
MVEGFYKGVVMGSRNILALVMSALFLVSCNTTKENKAHRIGRNARGNTSGYYQGTPGYGQSGSGTGTNNYNPTYGKSWGEITRGNSSQQAFQSAVTALLAPQQVTPGYVSGDSGQSTGIRFWGNAESSQGPINVSSNQNYTIGKTNARIRLVIYDEWTGQTNSAGQVIPEIPIDIGASTSGFVTAGGYIQGNYAQVAYEDGYGWVILDGYFNSSYYSGTVWTGTGNGNMTSLGQFNIPTCGFFRCY